MLRPNGTAFPRHGCQYLLFIESAKILDISTPRSYDDIDLDAMVQMCDTVTMRLTKASGLHLVQKDFRCLTENMALISVGSALNLLLSTTCVLVEKNHCRAELFRPSVQVCIPSMKHQIVSPANLISRRSWRMTSTTSSVVRVINLMHGLGIVF